MIISDEDQGYVMTRTLFTGLCFGFAACAIVMGLILHNLGSEGWQICFAGMGAYVAGEIFHKKSMKRLMEARRAGERSGPHDLVEDGGLVVVHGRLRLLQFLPGESVLRVGPDAEEEIYGFEDGVGDAVAVVGHIECHRHVMDPRD